MTAERRPTPVAARGGVHPTAIVSASAELGAGATVGAYAIVHDNVTLGDGAVIGAHCVLGEPLAAWYGGGAYVNPPLTIGAGAIIRSGSVIYAGSTLGDAFECGHRATVREQTVAGHHVRVGTNGDVQGHCRIGNYVRLHSSVFVAPDATLGDYVWLFPHVVLTNDPHPPSESSHGVKIDDFAAVGARSVVLPGVVIGRDALVGAGSVVRAAVPPEAVVVGSPARVVGTVRDVRSRDTGEAVYPWREHFSRGMPWQREGYAAWAGTDG